MQRGSDIMSISSQIRRARSAAARLRRLGRSLDRTFEPLESRRLYSVSATAAAGVLTVTGDANANAIIVFRDKAGHLVVNSGKAPVAVSGVGANPTVATITLIKLSGSGGDDS